MPAVLIALVLLAVLGMGTFWFMRANPATLARRLRFVLVALGSLVLGMLLLFGVRFLPGLLPELLGLAGIGIAMLLARAARRTSPADFSTPGSAKRTQVRTAFLQAWIDHGTGEVGGTVLVGRFASRGLDGMTDRELLELHGECARDADSLKILEAYLDRRLGADWRRAQKPPSAARGDMSRDEALAVLGLQEGATVEEIKAAHRRLIQRMHPDVGGSADLAARINRAKDVLVDL